MIQRSDALRAIHGAFPDQPFVVTLGGTIRELLAVVGRQPNHLYSLDAMGQTLPIGLGLALGLDDDERHSHVVVLEGDGSLLMGFSSLPTVGSLRQHARKLVLMVLDNGVYLATGGQPTASASVDLAAAAQACGWAGARDVSPESAEALQEPLDWAAKTPGPLLLRIRVNTQVPEGAASYFLEDPVILGRQFQDWLAGSGAADEPKPAK